MCLSNQNSKNAYRNYDDHTSQRFNRCRIETELLNLFDKVEDSLIDCDDSGKSRGNLDEANKENVSISNMINDRTSNGRNCNDEVDIKPFGHSSRRRKLNEVGYTIEENCHQDKLNTLTDDLFEDDWYNDDLFDSFNFSVDLDSTDCDQTIMTNSSQISYDDDSTTTSSTEFFNADEQESQDEGLSIANDNYDSQFIQKDGRLQRGFSLSSMYTMTDIISFKHDEDEIRSQFVIVDSKSSSRFTTESPRILELREKKRLMERYHEKKYNRFPALIEVDISSSVVY